MSNPSEIVSTIKAKCNTPDNESSVILKECTRAIKNLNRQLKNAKSVSKKAHIQACLGQIKGFQRVLKDRKVGGGTGKRRAETATNRVKWDDVNSAFDSRIRTGVITNIRHTDPKLFLIDCSALFKRRILNGLKKDEMLKVNAVLSGEFQTNKADKVLEDLKYLNTQNFAIHKNTNLDDWFHENIQEPLLTDLDEFQEKDSGWALSKLLNLTININKFNPLRAGSYIELPKQIAKREACINIHNADDICFAWAVTSALYPATININRTSSYPNPHDVLNLNNIRFPMTITQIPRFELQNNMSINVYRLQQWTKKIKASPKDTFDTYVIDRKKYYKVLPHYITKDKQSKHVNLLLVQDNYVDAENLDDLCSIKYHYVWIKNLPRLLSIQLSKCRSKKFICDRCLHYFYSQEKLNNHLPECIKLNHTVVPKIPEITKNIVEFKNYAHKEKVPFVIYSDMECLLLPVEDDPNKNTQKYQEHVPYSVGYFVKCNYDDTLSFYKSYTGPDCVRWFINELKQFAVDLETVFLCPLPMNVLSYDQENEFRNAIQCHICEQLFSQDSKKVRDHCHLTGRYRGPAHEDCNLNYQDSHTVPVIFHNLSGYDGHMIITALAEVEGRIDVLPVNKEKYISFTKHFDENMVSFRFLDSFRFLPASLAQLASDLTAYPILRSEFKELDDQQCSLLTRKGVYPYDYMNSWDRLLETELPTRYTFYNSLENMGISANDYAHAQNVWSSFNCQTMRDYSDLYLKTDILLLADVFEEFRKMGHETYGLDPAHAYTLPGYTWQCMLYKTKQKLELLTDYEMITFVERGIRGGLSQCSKRYAAANNKYMSNYNPEKESTYLMYDDINNQYGWAMSQKLPHGGFKWVDESYIKNFNVFSVADDAAEGYILEVDLEIPHELHDKLSDLPPCPEHVIPNGSKTEKLLATLSNKEKYIIHYRNLKQALTLGVKLKNIHRILSFNQSFWLKAYIDLNTNLRKLAKTEFGKNLFKLLNNAVFGKTMENIRKHSCVKLITKWDGRYGAEALISRPEFRSATIINRNLIIVELAKTEVFFNKPIYVGMCILDLAKTTIYDFHYNYMKNAFSECKILYTDTDSLIYEIKHTDPYEIMKRDCHQYFDTSDYAENNIYCIPQVNKKVLGKMKDENNGRIMTHFIGLRSKMYALKVHYTSEEIEKRRKKLEEQQKDLSEVEKELTNLGITKKSKGVKKSVVKNNITFEDYVECLETFTEKSINQNLIRSRKHEVYTIKQNKIGLSPHDDKRHLIKGTNDTLPWGHYAIMEE